MKSSLSFLMSFLILVLIILSVAQAALLNQTQQYRGTSGIISPLIQAQDIGVANPSQFFACKVSFREKLWTAVLWNCNCGRRWYRGKKSWRCNYCDNSFWSQSNALKVTYCAMDSWDRQIQKVFETGNTKSRNWREVSCPKGQYASKISARFGYEHSVAIGFSGVQIQCQTPNFSDKTLVQDSYGHKPEELSRNRQGTFVSSHQVYYEPNGKLTGIKWNFEPMPLVSKVAIKYSNYETLTPTRTIIETVKVTNNAAKIATNEVQFTKSYGIVNKWSTAQSLTKGYMISATVSVSAPKLASAEITTSTYGSKTESFGFDKDVATTFSSSQKTIVLVPPYKQVQISSVLLEQKVNVPFEATLTFVDRYTGQYIGERVVLGIFEGVMTSSVNTVITESDLPANLQKNATVQDVTNLIGTSSP